MCACQYDCRDLATPDSPNGGPAYRDAHAQKSTAASGSKSRKRKLRDNLAALASEGEFETPMYKRHSSDMALTSSCGSFLDITPDVSGYLQGGQLNIIRII